MGELNDVKPLEETSSTLSPMLPPPSKPEVQSNLRSVTLTKRSKKSMPAGGNRNTRIAGHSRDIGDAWPQHYEKLSIVPGSIYTGPILAMQPSTTKSIKSISMTAQSYRLKT